MTRYNITRDVSYGMVPEDDVMRPTDPKTCVVNKR